jgi:fumarate hydratase class II
MERSLDAGDGARAPKIGYDKAAKIAKTATKGTTLREEAVALATHDRRRFDRWSPSA